jgi:D-alanyl-D-alanine carboxypeptidase/D-alanyl-D-alanine-endopeptidase (penicillin-binding protein 4)
LKVIFQKCNRRLYRDVIFLLVVFLFGSLALLSSCSISRQISKQANKILLNDSAISTGHIGISIYEPATGKYWYNYDATKYFVPASNTKLFSLYAGMKYLGDSLVGIRYEIDKDSIVRIQPTGDPTFLHPEFINQPVYNFLKSSKWISFTNRLFADNFMGMGWAWDDYKESYLVQRSNFPIYGNLINIKKVGNSVSVTPSSQPFIIPEYTNLQNGFDVQKKWDDNLIIITAGTNQRLFVPFTPNSMDIIEMLKDTLHLPVMPDLDFYGKLKNVIHTQPVDSLFKPMMHRSDNFYAEQTLLMASNEHIGFMNDEKIIDTILNTDLNDIPQRPKWVDGSGLSRYNLFTPQSFVYILNKLKNEFGLERLKNILPTGGEGTLSAYYKKDAGFIFAKTGTLSNHCALSGFIITKKNKLLIFSVLNNHYQTNATPVRKAVEKFLEGLREKY